MNRAPREEEMILELIKKNVAFGEMRTDMKTFILTPDDTLSAWYKNVQFGELVKFL